MTLDDDLCALWAERVRALQDVPAAPPAPPAPEPESPPRDRPERRRQREVRARTLSRKFLKSSAGRGEREGDVDATIAEYDRPRTRGDCLSMERPCPFASCQYHLYADVGPYGGLKLNFPDVEVWELEETCALDVAEHGGEAGSGQGPGRKLEEVGAVMNVTRERVRQIEVRALAKVRRADARREGALAEHADDEGYGRARRHLPVVEDGGADEDGDVDE